MNSSETQFSRRHAVATLSVLSLVILPRPAMANNGLKAMGEAFEMLAKILVGMTATGFLLAIINVLEKRIWLRVLSILLVSPLAVIALLSLRYYPLAALIGFGILLLFGFISYKGLRKDDDESGPGLEDGFGPSDDTGNP